MTPTSRVSRRSLVHGAAWSVPAVALATQAPALAVSSCVEQNLDFADAGYTRSAFSTSSMVGRYTWTVDQGTLEMEITTLREANNFSTSHLNRSGGTLSGTDRQGLYLVLNRSNDSRARSRQNIRFLLNGSPTTVENFEFEFGDIDSEPNRERLWFNLANAPSSEVIVNSSQVTGAGRPDAAGGPYTRASTGTYDVNNSTSTAGNVQIGYDSVSAFTFLYDALPIQTGTAAALTTHFIPKTLTLPCPEPA